MGTRRAPARSPKRQHYSRPTVTFQESEMGKYFLGWILGVPAVVLVGIYLVSHLL